MADIKQAAKWMKEGLRVSRGEGYTLSAVWHGGDLYKISAVDDYSGAEVQYTLFADDLLSEDWEIV